MTTVLAKHDPYWATGHLGNVIAEMRLAGAPTLRVMAWRGRLCALEGSHRLAAAHHLGLIPKVIILEPDTAASDAWLDRLMPTLPAYEFPYVLALSEGAF